MNISKFAVGQPDSDGDVRQPEVECVITNPTQADVRMIRQSLIVTDKNGFCIGHNANNQEDCDIEPGGDTTITPWLTFEQGFSETEEGSFRLTVSATLYARVFFSLGEVDVPTKDLSREMFEREIASTVIEGPLKVSVLRGKPDDEGKIAVKAMVIVRNKSEHHLPRVEMKSELLDSDGGVIDETTDWQNCLGGVECIVHLANRAHVMDEQSSDPLALYRKVNTAGTLHLARQAAAAGIKRFIFISSINACNCLK
jgi:hypothetical protein